MFKIRITKKRLEGERLKYYVWVKKEKKLRRIFISFFKVFHIFSIFKAINICCLSNKEGITFF